MKKSICLLIISLIGLQLLAFDIDKLDNEIIERINLQHFSKSKVILETGFGSSKFVDVKSAEELIGKEIFKVSLVYTTYREVDDFSQINLNEKRWINLFKLMPELKEDVAVNFKEIGINRCARRECANDQLHGFIIEYRKETFGYGNLKLQTGMVNAGDSLRFVGAQGTRVIVPENAFVDAHGNEITGMIQVQLREALTPQDIVAANLHTVTSDGRALQSGGMVNFQTYQNGKKLQLKPGKEITIEMPKNDEVEDMMVWDGEWVDGKLRWNDPQELLGVIDNEEEDSIAVEKKMNHTSIAFDTNIRENNRDEKSLQFSKISWFTDNDSVVKVELVMEDTILTFERTNYTAEVGEENELSPFQSKEIDKWLQGKKIPESVHHNFWGWHGVPLSKIKRNESNFIETKYLPNRSNVFRRRSMGWCNIDKLIVYGKGGVNNLIVKCGNDANMEDVAISLVIPKDNIFLPGYRLPSGDYSFMTVGGRKVFSLPRGRKAHIVMTGKIDKTDFSANKKIVLGRNEVEETKFVPKDKITTLKEIKEQI